MGRPDGLPDVPGPSYTVRIENGDVPESNPVAVRKSWVDVFSYSCQGGILHVWYTDTEGRSCEAFHDISASDVIQVWTP